jgi:hypothetical protein
VPRGTRPRRANDGYLAAARAPVYRTRHVS